MRDDRSLIPAAFAETLRYSPPVHMIMRQPAEDVELSGGIVEAGRTVTCLIGAANRDDRRFDRPEVFDILRADLDHVARLLRRRRPPRPSASDGTSASAPCSSRSRSRSGSTTSSTR